MRVTFLGTGTSVGVPRMGCRCYVCRSDEPKNKRLRCSVLLEYSGHTILVDTTPDLRTQALRYGVDRVDTVLFTHAHADHLHGLDDIRCYCFEREAPMPCYGEERTLERIRRVFDYAFNSPYKQALPQLELRRIEGPMVLFGRTVQPLTIYHGKLPVLGFRLGGFAYVTDCSAIPPGTMAQLRDLDILVLDALRYKEHPTHFNVDQALAVVAELKPRHTYFTHIAHELDHYPTNAALPEHVELAYDGLVLNNL
jgi:phosphoribosyl 1,2-cyclic phosphate phosphodiesterase